MLFRTKYGRSIALHPVQAAIFSMCVMLMTAQREGTAQVPEAPNAFELEILPPADEVPAAKDASATDLDWWRETASQPLLGRAQWVKFDLETVLLDTLANSPRIQAVSRRTSATLERIVQQDAAFDPSLLLESRLGRTNDPVGNSLTTGGPPRLIEESVVTRAGIQKNGRRGTVIDLSQELGTLDSNSLFFEPTNQGNARLNLSLTQPLLGRSGQVYNERLLTQARIDGGVSWQEMRGEVERRIADVVTAYWQLYELRCQLVQVQALLDQAKAVESILDARRGFDASEIEVAKANARVARRFDRTIELRAEVEKQQIRLARLVGAEVLVAAGGELELIPEISGEFPDLDLKLRDAIVQGLENRPEVRSAAMAMESAALSISVTRTELVPELTAVVETYLAGLNGNNGVFRSFGDQFSVGGPGVSAGLRYDLPIGRRAAQSRHREAKHRYQQRSEELREAMQTASAEIEIALVNVRTAAQQQQTKQQALVTATREETMLTRRWEMIAGDGANVGGVLENLLDAQQRRADAESEWTAAKGRYRTSLVELQRAMGTLLQYESITPERATSDNSIHFSRPQTYAEITVPEPLPTRDNSLAPPLDQSATPDNGLIDDPSFSQPVTVEWIPPQWSSPNDSPGQMIDQEAIQ